MMYDKCDVIKTYTNYFLVQLLYVFEIFDFKFVIIFVELRLLEVKFNNVFLTQKALFISRSNLNGTKTLNFDLKKGSTKSVHIQ